MILVSADAAISAGTRGIYKCRHCRFYNNRDNAYHFPFRVHHAPCYTLRGTGSDVVQILRLSEAPRPYVGTWLKLYIVDSTFSSGCGYHTGDIARSYPTAPGTVTCYNSSYRDHACTQCRRVRGSYSEVLGRAQRFSGYPSPRQSTQYPVVTTGDSIDSSLRPQQSSYSADPSHNIASRKGTPEWLTRSKRLVLCGLGHCSRSAKRSDCWRYEEKCLQRHPQS